MLGSTTTGAVMAGYNNGGATVMGAWARGNEQSEVFDTLFYMYNGVLPTVTAPTIADPVGLTVNGQYGPQNINLQQGMSYSAYINAIDTNGASRCVVRACTDAMRGMCAV